MIKTHCVTAVFFSVLVACDSGKLSGRPSGPNPQVETPPACGNGIVDDDETCDVGITAGNPGACKKKCSPSPDACVVNEFRGERCTSECVEVAITAPHDGDGCCPAGSSFSQDLDCTAPPPTCGNGVLDVGETCDPTASGADKCPTSCPVAGPCSTYALVGADCSITCKPTPKTRADGDGCCASPGDADSDCAALPKPGACPAQTLTFKEFWRWASPPLTLSTTSSMVVSPLVTQTNDDNHDGKIDANDTPDVVALVQAVGLSGPTAALVSFSGNNGNIIFNRDLASYDISVYTHPAAADIDHDGKVEIVLAEMGDATNLELAGLVAFENDGTFKWRSAALPDPIPAESVGAISIADLEGDGHPEILLGNRVWNGDGTLKWAAPAAAVPAQMGRFSFAADLDPVSPGLEVLDGPNLYAYDGTVLWANTSIGFGETAIGDCDGDGEPEIIVASQPNPPGTANLVLLDRHGVVKAGPKTILPSAVSTITAGDLDGDGDVEFVASVQSKLVAFDCALSNVMNSDTTVDVSAGAGPVLFDFDADGKSEIVFADEQKIRVMSHTGSELWSTTRIHVTALETPIVADIDGDGQAEIVVPQGRLVGAVPLPVGVITYRSDTGKWAGARKTWNQHAFQPLSFFDDGQVAANPGAFWARENMYRANMVVGTVCP